MTSSFHHRLCAVFTVLTVFAAMSAAAVAQMLQPPQPPLQATGRVIPGTAGVSFSWMRNPQGGAAAKFYVYYAKGQANTTMQFTKIAEITPGADSMFEERSGMCSWYYIANLGAGVHTFYVTAWNSTAESGKSNFIYVQGIGNPQTTMLRITSQFPMKQMLVGESVTYTPVVELSTNSGMTWTTDVAGLVRYTLAATTVTNVPQGITIDESTGEISWTAQQPGQFSIGLMVQLLSETAHVWQTLQFSVKKCSNPATITGTVTDEKTGAAANGGYVVATKIDQSNIPNPNGGRDSMFTSIGSVSPDGTYKLMVDEGEYYVQASAQGYDSEYFDNSPGLAGATTIKAACGIIYTADFALAKTVVPNHFRVSGKVSAKETGDPVSPAMVTFLSNVKAQGSIAQMRQTVWTDLSGRYEIMLPENTTFVAYAEGYSRNSNNPGTEYLVCYYDGADEPTNATEIRLTADRADVNFQLKKRPVYQNGISGSLTDSVDVGIVGNVVAYRLQQNAVINSRWVAVTQNGAFSLQNLTPGEYVLLGYPTNKQLSVPGYYVEGGFATLDWSKATRLTVTETSVITNVKIFLRNFRMMGGRGGIKGFCRNSGGVIKGDNIQGAAPVAGAVVCVTDNNGTIVDYTFTTNDGGYDISTLKPGTFTLSAGRVGFGQMVQTVKVNDEITPVTTDIDMKPSSATGVEEPVTGSVAAYPNPATGESLAVTFDGNAGQVALTLTNAAGVTVYSTEISVIDGANTAVLPTGNLAPGAYMVRVANAAIPVVIVR